MNITPEELWALIEQVGNSSIDNSDDLAAEVRRLRALHDNENERADALLDEVQVLGRLNASQSADLVALRHKLNDAEGHRDALAERLAEAEKANQTYESNLNEATKECDEIARAKQDNDAEAKLVEKGLRDALAQCKRELDSARNEVSRLDEELAVCSQAETSLRKELRNTENDLATERRKNVERLATFKLVTRERDITLRRLADIESNIESGGISDQHLIASIKDILEREA